VAAATLSLLFGIGTVDTSTAVATQSAGIGISAMQLERELAERHPVRLPFTAGERAAAGWLVNQLDSFGISQHGITVQAFDRTNLSDAQEFTLSRLTSENAGDAQALSQNVVVRFAGQDGNPGVIVIGAGYDTFMPADLPRDPASGANVALLLEIVQHLQNAELVETVYVVFFGADAVGRAGAQYFFNALPADEQANLQLVVNVDSIGAAETLFFTASVCDGGERCEEQSAAFGAAVSELAEAYASDLVMFKEEEWDLGDAPTCACCIFGVPESVVGVSVVNLFAFDFAGDFAALGDSADAAASASLTNRALGQYQMLIQALLNNFISN
jgi:glutathione S-transferase